MNVLIAEQDRDFTFAFRTLLELYGHRVSVAYDGTQAIMKTETEKFDIALLDHQLPRVRTEDLITRLKSHGILIIVMTDSKITSDILRQKIIGNAYIQLPFLPNELYSLMENIYNKKNSHEVIKFEDVDIDVSSFKLCNTLPLTCGEIDTVQRILEKQAPDFKRESSNIASVNQKLSQLGKKPRIKYMGTDGYRMVI